MKNHQKNLSLCTILTLITLVSFALAPSVTLAATTAAATPASYKLLEPLPCIGTGCTSSTLTEIGAGSKTTFVNYIQYIFNLIIFIAAGAAVFMIVLGGFQYMTTDSWSGKNEGLTKVKNALLGLLLVLTSYIILRTIDPRLVAIPATLVKPLNLKTSTSTLDIFGELDAMSSKYLAYSKEAQDQITATTKTIDDLHSTVSSLNDQILKMYHDKTGSPVSDTVDVLCSASGYAKTTPDADMKALCDKRDAALSGTRDAAIKGHLQIIKAGLNEAVASCLNHKPITNDAKQKCEDSFIEMGSQTKNFLKNDSYYDTQIVDDYVVGATATIDTAAIVDSWTGKKATNIILGNIVSIRDKAAATIKDSTIKNDMIEYANKAITDLGGKLSQTKTYLDAYNATDIYTSSPVY